MALLWKMICNSGDPMSLRHTLQGALHSIKKASHSEGTLYQKNPIYYQKSPTSYQKRITLYPRALYSTKRNPHSTKRNTTRVTMPKEILQEWQCQKKYYKSDNAKRNTTREKEPYILPKEPYTRARVPIEPCSQEHAVRRKKRRMPFF